MLVIICMPNSVCVCVCAHVTRTSVFVCVDQHKPKNMLKSIMHHSDEICLFNIIKNKNKNDVILF